MAGYARVKKWLLVGLGIWLVLLLGVSRMFLATDLDSDLTSDHTLQKLLGKNASPEDIKKVKSALDKIELLQQQNNNLQKKLLDLRHANADQTKERRENVMKESGEHFVPTKKFEFARRRLENGIVEFWRYASTHLKKLFDIDDAVAAQTLAKEMLEFLTQHKRVVWKDIEALEEAAELNEWKLNKSVEMSRIVRNRLRNLQNPKDCASSRKLRCSINKSCGFGCQIHHATYCLIAGYALNRTVILDSRNWRYSKKGWESVFLPLSGCIMHADAKISIWNGDAKSEQALIVEMPIIDNIQAVTSDHQAPGWLPWAVPSDLFPRIHSFHRSPLVWWMGQLVSYIWRLQPSTQDYMTAKSKLIGFGSPVVGIHVRRTDKIGTEAAKHEIEEYMKYVDEYYDQLEVSTQHKISVRRVFVATDDAAVFQECKTKFPKYEVIGDVDAMQSAGLNKRYTDASLIGIIADIHFLSQSDYLVCTFSSQVCRLAYELMQTRYPDAKERYRSLDDVYYYGGQSAHDLEAILPHEARSENEISFVVGDLLGISGNHWDGYTMAEHRKTDTKGLFPSYKAKEHFVTYDMPRYEDKPHS